MNTNKSLIISIILLIVVNTTFNYSYSQNQRDSIPLDSNKRINIALAKGVSARKQLQIYKQQVKTDNIIINLQDSLLTLKDKETSFFKQESYVYQKKFLAEKNKTRWLLRGSSVIILTLFTKLIW